MPAQLLVIEPSDTIADALDTQLRRAGLASRVQRAMFPVPAQLLTEADLLLCNRDLPGLDEHLPELLAQAPELPVIMIDHRPDARRSSGLLQLGAMDVVPALDPALLPLVVHRELKHRARARRLEALATELAAVEARCDLLLATTDVPIGYLHEGLHVHANAAYLTLFGFRGLDDLRGRSLMDLLAEPGTSELREALKAVRLDRGMQGLRFVAHPRAASATETASDARILSGQLFLTPVSYEGESCVQVTVQADPRPEAKIGTASDESASVVVGNSAIAAAPSATTTRREASPERARYVLFQPIVSLRTQGGEHYEIYPTTSAVDTAGQATRAFMPAKAGECTGGQHPPHLSTNQRLLQVALEVLSEHQAAGRDLRLTVPLQGADNAGGETTEDQSETAAEPLVDWLRERLAMAGIAPERLTIQIAANAARATDAPLARLLTALHQLGCATSIALPDTVSSMDDTFTALPIDQVKLNPTTVATLCADVDGRALLARQIGQIEQSGRCALVPGVATAAMLAALWQSGANQVQGDYLQPPLATLDYDFDPEA